jgi:1-acyl-sn-glycerol-3-phosphate acyltransferase
VIRSVRVVNWVMRRVFQVVCRIDTHELAKVPQRGPLIAVVNHVNFLEAPVLIPHLDPRPLTGLAKRETWNNPLFWFLFNQWGGIPIDRGTVDREAFRLCLEALERGDILAVAPEGTRSKNGCLLQGKPGVVALALRSKAPLLPIGCYGYENFWQNFKRLRRTDFHISVGRPFCLEMGAKTLSSGEALSRETRQAVTDEIMCKIAELLPERYRGYYQHAGKAPYRFAVDI